MHTRGPSEASVISAGNVTTLILFLIVIVYFNQLKFFKGIGLFVEDF